MALQTKTISANGSKGHHKFTLTVTENSTITANNTSSVSWSLVLSPVVKNYDWNYSSTVPVTYSIVFNGTTYSGNIMSYDGSSTVTVRSGSATITHNADGNKSISYRFSVSSISASYLPGSASASGSMALTYIPRAATITSATNFTDKQNPTITYSNPAGTAVTTLKACISLTGSADDIAYRDISKTGTSYTFPLTDAERAVLRNATTSSNSRTVYFFLWTVIGGNDYRVNVQRTFSIVNADPVVTGTVTDSNDTTYALTGSRSKLIKYYSNATVTANATPQKGASINESKYVIRNGSNTWNGKTHTFNNVESNVFTFSAEDSRGNVGTYTLTPAPTMVNYIRLTCDISNNRPDALGNMTVACSGNYFNGSFGAVSNTLTVQYRYKLSTDSWLNTEDEWNDMTVTISGNKYSATADFVIPDFGQQKIYSFETRAIDKLSTISSGEQSVQSMPIFHWGESDFAFEVPVYDEYNTRISNGVTLNSTGIDPNTTLEREILTNVNAPTSAYYSITTIFYNSKTVSSARTQIATPYNSSSDYNMYFRYYYSGSWTSWTKVVKSQLANQEMIYGTTTSGTAIEALNLCSTGNNCVVGYGGYASNTGATNIYGNNVNIYTKGSFYINGLSGMVKATNGAISAATAGTDYVAPSYFSQATPVSLTMINGATSQGWYNVVYKSGNVGLVLLAITVSSSSGIANNTTIANLPTGYYAWQVAMVNPSGNASNTGAIGVINGIVRVSGILAKGSYTCCIPYIIA